MSQSTQVAVIGAGPYGLSLAAHLAAARIEFRIFGAAMQTWRESMPPGMLLKSDGFASNLHDPAGAFPLETFCADAGLDYAPTGFPVPVETFTAYGQAFQRRFAPDLEDERVVDVAQVDGGFELRLGNGGRAHARQVVVASGIREFGYVPSALASLPEEFVSHSSRYGRVDALDGRDVAVMGAGASAIDLAALLADRCAQVSVIARAPVIRFHNPPRARTLADAVLRPMNGLGPGWKSYLCVHAPLAFHAMPEPFRLDATRRHLGPAPGWFMRQKVEGRMPCLTGAKLLEAGEAGSRVRLVVAREGEASRTILADHVVAATGYRVDLARLGFLGPQLRRRVRLTGSSPALSRDFESSVPGLFFMGASAADSFGPLLRFAYGAGFAARRVSRRLGRASSRTGGGLRDPGDRPAALTQAP